MSGPTLLIDSVKLSAGTQAMYPVNQPHPHFHIDPKVINAHCSCFSLRKATRAVTQFYDHLLGPTGIRSTQFNLLVTMASISARTLTEMANILVMDRTTLTRNLKPLEKMGLITKGEVYDKRSKAYSLTEKGRAIVTQAIPLWEQAQAKLKLSLGEERFRQLNQELEALTKVMGEL